MEDQKRSEERVTDTGVYWNFTRTCQDCGRTIRVASGQEQPHECDQQGTEAKYYAEICRVPGWLLRWRVVVHETPDDPKLWMTERDWWTCVLHRSAVRTARRWIKRQQRADARFATPERVEVPEHQGSGPSVAASSESEVARDGRGVAR